MPAIPSPQTYDADLAYVKKHCAAEPLKCSGLETLIVTPSTLGKAEFASSVRIIVVNGNDYTPTETLNDARLVANKLHGPVHVYFAYANGDAHTFNVGSATEIGSEMAQDAIAHRSVHFMTFGSGANLVDFALGFTWDSLQHGRSVSDAKKLMGQITVETFAAREALEWPPGIIALQYLKPGDTPVMYPPKLANP